MIDRYGTASGSDRDKGSTLITQIELIACELNDYSSQPVLNRER